MVMIPESIRTGFKNTGIYPINANAEKLNQTSISMTNISIVDCYDDVRLGSLGTSGLSSLNDKWIFPNIFIFYRFQGDQ